MKVSVENEGENSIRIIVDGDTINDTELAPGEILEIETQEEGKIELREFGE